MNFSHIENTYIEIPLEIVISGLRVEVEEVHFTNFGGIIPPHSHSHYEGVLILEGTGTYLTYHDKNGKLIKYEKKYLPGTLLSTSPGMVHGYHPEGDQKILYWKWIILSGNQCVNLNKLLFLCQTYPDLRSFAYMLYEYATIAAIENKGQLISFLKSFYIQTFSQLLSEIQNVQKESHYLIYECTVLSDKILQFIKDNFYRKISLQTLAAYFNKSPRQINRILKAHDPPVYFSKELNRQRIKAASQLLRSNPDIDIHELADRCGFEDVYYFRKVFRQYAGHGNL